MKIAIDLGTYTPFSQTHLESREALASCENGSKMLGMVDSKDGHRHYLGSTNC